MQAWPLKRHQAMNSFLIQPWFSHKGTHLQAKLLSPQRITNLSKTTMYRNRPLHQHKNRNRLERAKSVCSLSHPTMPKASGEIIRSVTVNTKSTIPSTSFPALLINFIEVHVDQMVNLPLLIFLFLLPHLRFICFACNELEVIRDRVYWFRYKGSDGVPL